MPKQIDQWCSHSHQIDLSLEEGIIIVINLLRSIVPSSRRLWWVLFSSLGDWVDHLVNSLVHVWSHLLVGDVLLGVWVWARANLLIWLRKFEWLVHFHWLRDGGEEITTKCWSG